MTRDRPYQQALGVSLQSAVKKARVLMVGAGGIGCELLKNLACSGFAEVHIVDLDTIDLSNLNRQFLFRHEHIKKSKALVAKEAALKFNPNVNIVAYHANIKDSQFNVQYFRGFNVVFNALDNLDARRHVNKMCLAASVPLIESGTTGFNGQVQVIKKGVTACYDCQAKEVPKSFPVCTIRSTPSQPIHCIVWGKSYLLNEIFGASEDESAFDHTTNQDNAQEVEELRRESAALRKIRNAVGTDAFPKMLFDKVFGSDIMRLQSIEDMWKSRRPPEPLSYDDVKAKAAPAIAETQNVLSKGQSVWSLEENFAVFLDSLDRLSKRITQMRARDTSGEEPMITFDKDDEDTLDFVSASANIRSHVFGIDCKSRFDIKQMAGNIIPAIATTNAIVAGLSVLEAYKVLQGDISAAKEIFLTPFATARRLATDRPREPNPTCPVCGVFQVSALVDFSNATLEDLVEDFVRKRLGFGDREFSVNTEAGMLYDPDETELLPKKLSEIGVSSNSFITIMDEDDEPFVNVVINIAEWLDGTPDRKPESPISGIGLPEKPEVPLKPKPSTPAEDSGSKTIVAAEPAKGTKRSHPDDAEEPVSKKAKVVDPAEVVVIEDDGAIDLTDD